MGTEGCPQISNPYQHQHDICSVSWLWYAEGRAVLMLLPSEQEAMLKLLEAAKVPVKAIKMNPQKQQPITGSLQALLSKDPALKVCARPCYRSA